MNEYNFDIPKSRVKNNPEREQYSFDIPPSKAKAPDEVVKATKDPDGFWDWASVEGARTFLEGMSFNMSDNVGSAISAAILAAQDKGEGLGAWRKYYDILQKDYKEGQEKFEQENPTAAAGLTIAGSIANPANLLAAPVATANVASKVGQVGAMATRAGIEGGLYGLGEAESFSEIPSKVAEGAIWGSATAAPIGYMFKGLSRKNIQKDLDSVNAEGEEVFTPITLAADMDKGGESTIHGLYRDIIAPTYLAKTIIKNQEDLITRPLERRVINAKENLSLIGKDVKANTELLTQKFKDTKEQMKEGFRDVQARIGDDIKEAAEAIKATNEVTKNAAKEGLTPYSIELNQQILKDAAGFREQVLNLSFPTAVGSRQAQGLIDKIKRAENPQKQNAIMEDLWNKFGFQSVKKNDKLKDRFFPLKKGYVDTEVYSKIVSTPSLRAAAKNKNSLVKSINDNLGFINDSINKGRINVNELMSYRSTLARKANSFADTTVGEVDRAVLRTAVSAIDDVILRKLPSEAQRKAFKADKEAWAHYSKFDDAVEAKGAAGEFGRFDPSDYINVLKKSDKSKSQGLLQKEAEVVNSRIEANRKQLKDHAHEVMRDTMNQQTIALSKLAKQKKAALDKAKKEAAKRYKGAEAQFAESYNKAQRGIEVQKLQTELAEIEEHLSLLNSQRSQTAPSWFQSIAATGLLGGLITGSVFGAAGGAAVGIGLGGALGTKGGQRLIAGQTGAQTAIRENIGNVLNTSRLVGNVMAQEAVTDNPQQ